MNARFSARIMLAARREASRYFDGKRGNEELKEKERERDVCLKVAAKILACRRERFLLHLHTRCRDNHEDAAEDRGGGICFRWTKWRAKKHKRISPGIKHERATCASRSNVRVYQLLNRLSFYADADRWTRWTVDSRGEEGAPAAITGSCAIAFNMHFPA